MPFAMRRDLCEVAVVKRGRIHVCARGERSSRWARTAVLQELSLSLADLLNGRKLNGVELMGSDVVARILTKIIGANRNGDVSREQRQICWFRRPGPGGENEEHYIRTEIVPHARSFGIDLIQVDPAKWGSPLHEISSTAVRMLVMQRNWEALATRGWLAPAVIERLRQFDHDALEGPLGRR